MSSSSEMEKKCGNCENFRKNRVDGEPFGEETVKFDDGFQTLIKGVCKVKNIAGFKGTLFSYKLESTSCIEPSKFEPIEKTSGEIPMVPPSQEGLVFEA